MSLESRLTALVQAVGADVKALYQSLTGKQATLVSGENIKAINGQSLLGSGSLNIGAGSEVIAGGVNLYKVDPSTVAFIKTGADTASVKAGTKVDVDGTVVTLLSETSIVMPTLVAGTDYIIWFRHNGVVQANDSWTTPPGDGTWRRIGGFHYAPGGNAAAQAGGDTTPQINEYSFWDLLFRPACPDPRGMTLVAGAFWADIYLLGVDHTANGTSKYNVTIADGSSPPKVPLAFGGNGTAAYANMTWWVAAEVMRAYGKRLPTYSEFAALAYGTTEGQSSGGTDVPTTGVTGTGATTTWEKFTSKWGVVQSTGCLWIFGEEFGGPSATAAWSANTGGRGSTFQLTNVLILGGTWTSTTNSGSRTANFGGPATNSQSYLGARGVCDHIVGPVIAHDNLVVGDVTLAGAQTLTNKTLGNYTETVFTITDGTTVNLDPNNGPIQLWTLGGNRYPNQVNWSNGQTITLMVDDGDARVLDWATLGVVWKTDGGSPPDLQLTGRTALVLSKIDGVIYGWRGGDA